MIISSEQAQKAIEYLQMTNPHDLPAQEHSAGAPICPGFLGKVCNELLDLPDAREDRIWQARQAIDGHPPEAALVAEKMIARLLSDSLR